MPAILTNNSLINNANNYDAEIVSNLFTGLCITRTPGPREAPSERKTWVSNQLSSGHEEDSFRTPRKNAVAVSKVQEASYLNEDPTVSWSNIWKPRVDATGSSSSVSDKGPSRSKMKSKKKAGRETGAPKSFRNVSTQTPVSKEFESAHMARIRSRRRTKKIEDSFPVATGDPSPLIDMPAYEDTFMVDSGATVHLTSVPSEAFTNFQPDSTSCSKGGATTRLRQRYVGGGGVGCD